MSNFRCDKLCGDGVCCSALRWSLGNVDIYGVPWRSDAERREYPSLAVWEAIIDPAKLAELMGSALQARGIETHIIRQWIRPVCYGPSFVLIQAQGDIALHIESGDEAVVRKFDMPTARALLLAIMSTPANETSRDECEQIMRRVSN